MTKRVETLSRVIVLALACILVGGDAAGTELAARRAGRRAAVRAAATLADKAGGPAPFALLVIPVDFADNRLPSGWEPAPNLGPRLDGPGPATLRNYFAVASGGRCDLRILQTPLVSLAGTRRDYSDVGFNGFTRTRRLAQEALEAVRDLGIAFRRVDNDGPDGIAGTSDDDGEVDGVLILHAAPGQENDPVDGLIQPLQYFLAEPVVSGGVSASFYAVAAMRSGLGIWAHETAHLLGLEDRYDPTLPTDGTEVQSRGGLGRFSLMAAGAWGTGAGDDPALPDAYSLAQLGWCEWVDLPAPGLTNPVLRATVETGRAFRVWTHGRPADEYFLLEVRDPTAAPPFDAAVPDGGMVIYHVDETVPEGQVATAGGEHLRVQVVEADDDDGLRDGRDEGSAADLFPGTTAAVALTPATSPDSGGYRGPSAVSITGIAHERDDDGTTVVFEVTADDGPAVLVDLGFQGTEPTLLVLAVESVGADVRNLSVTLTATAPAWGTFASGGTVHAADLVESAAGVWTPAAPIVWMSDPALPEDAATRFVVEVAAPDWQAPTVSRTWYWRDNPGILAFDDAWPGAWAVEHPSGETGTTWTRWDDRSPAVAAGAHVLACVNLDHATGEAWPDVSYDNRAHATLTSGPLGPETTGVRIVHTWDTELLVADQVMDGASAAWVAPDGTVVAAVPVDGWPVVVSPQSLAALHGRSAWGGIGSLGGSGQPVWRTDVIPLPTDRPGPWRLRLEFASNGRDWNHRGWQIAGFEPLTGPLPAAALELAWDGTELAWNWPWQPEGDPVFVVQQQGEFGWEDLLVRAFEPPFAGGRYHIPAEDLLLVLPGPATTRSVVRVVGPSPYGDLASGPAVVFPDGGDGVPIVFGRPWPNPTRGGLRFSVTVPSGAAARVAVYDLRGRRVRSLVFPPGEHVGSWDGIAADGRRAAAGTYILRLEGSNGNLQHKVVLLH